MITVNPITISTSTRFQVSSELAPPYEQAAIKVAGDGTWSPQCGVVERLTSNPVPEYGTIFTEGAHNVAPHEGEPVPCVSARYNYTGVDFDQAPWNPDYLPGTYEIAMDAVPSAWRVNVNIIHGTEEEIRDAHRRPRGGCLLPWWSWPPQSGTDHAKANFERMLKSGEISLEPAAATTPSEPKAKRAPVKKKSSPKPKKRPKYGPIDVTFDFQSDTPGFPKRDPDTCKYVYWAELERAASAGHSLLVYQHFPRVERSVFIADKLEQLKRRLHSPWVQAFRTANVVFFMVAHPRHAAALKRVPRAVAQGWPGQFEIVRDGLVSVSR